MALPDSLVGDSMMSLGRGEACFDAAVQWGSPFEFTLLLGSGSFFFGRVKG